MNPLTAPAVPAADPRAPDIEAGGPCEGARGQVADHLLQHHPAHLPGLRAQRDPYADVGHPLFDPVGRHGVEAGRREDERDQRDGPDDRLARAAVPRGVVERLLHRAEAEHRQVRIDRADRLTNQRRRRGRIARPANDERRHARRVGASGKIDERFGLSAPEALPQSSAPRRRWSATTPARRSRPSPP